MLQISSAKIAHIALRAREFDAGISGWGAAGRGQRGVEDELRAFIAGLNEDEQASLVAVMWIGRDTFAAEELDEAIATARAEATAPTEDYLMGIPMLADHLEDGLQALGLSAEDEEAEVLPLT